MYVHIWEKETPKYTHLFMYVLIWIKCRHMYKQTYKNIYRHTYTQIGNNVHLRVKYDPIGFELECLLTVT